ncbi:MAG: CoA transferase [Chloroflexi bacterium]|nr:CoA transferase [Chloroflexota bacterium]
MAESAEQQNAAPGPLLGLRVIERATGVSVPYCGKLLADLGAEVIKIEQPGTGDPARRVGPFYHDQPGPDSSLLFNYLNTNKLGVTLDVATQLGAELLGRLLQDADVLLFGGELREMEAQGLGYARLRERYPRLVGVYVTPFGLTGPYRDRWGGELVSAHMSALGYLTPGDKDLPQDMPPLKPGGRQALFVAGQTAATATLHGLFAREAAGQGQCVDVSELEPLTSFQFMNMARWVYAGDPGARSNREFGRMLKCKDGAFAMLVGQDHMWAALVDMLGHPDWADNPDYQTRAGRSLRQQETWRHIEEWAAGYTKEEIYRMGQARRIPVFPENTIAEAVDSAQVRSRGFLQEIPLACGGAAPGPSAPYQFAETPWSIRRPAPRLGQHNQEVFCGRLGLPQAELAAAFEAGVV